MEWACISGWMEENILVSGGITKCTELVCIFGLMVENMRGNI